MCTQRPKKFLMVGIVFGLAMSAGVAHAQELESRFFNSTAEIFPSAVYSDTQGFVRTFETEMSTSVSARCDDAVDNDFEIQCTSPHADKGTITQNVARVEQREKNNDIEVRILGRVGGNDAVDTVCSCERARQSGKVKTVNSKMALSCRFKKCSCLGDLTSAELESGLACFDSSRGFKGKLKKQLLDGRIKSKGVILKAP